MDAIQSMQTYLSTRPGGFASIQAGIEWHVRTRTLRNSESARASVPALLVYNEEADTARPWRWRTNLAITQPFWEDWFAGLSKKFLEARGGKLLLLAGTDRLDTELTIGQMQGKLSIGVFQERDHTCKITRSVSNGIVSSFTTHVLTESSCREIRTSGVPGSWSLHPRGSA